MTVTSITPHARPCHHGALACAECPSSETLVVRRNVDNDTCASLVWTRMAFDPFRQGFRRPHRRP